MSQWYYADRNRQRQGPIEAAELAALFRRNEVGPDTLVWRDGLPQWQALGDFAGELDLFGDAHADVPLPPPPFVEAASDDHAMPAAHESDYQEEVLERTYTAPTSPYTPPTAAVASAGDHVVHGGEVVYAGFWKRFAALVIDNFLVTVVYYAVIIALVLALGVGGSLLTGTGDGPTGALFALMALAYLSYPVISALYFVSMESSSKQATLGKMAVGIKVTDDDGHRLSRGRALGRWTSHLLCYLTIYIGYVLAAFTDRKRGLHDMAASTLVVDKWAYTASPQLQRRELGVVTIVIIVLAILMALAYLAIVFAIAIPAYQAYVQRAGGG